MPGLMPLLVCLVDATDCPSLILNSHLVGVYTPASPREPHLHCPKKFHPNDGYAPDTVDALANTTKVTSKLTGNIKQAKAVSHVSLSKPAPLLLSHSPPLLPVLFSLLITASELRYWHSDLHQASV